MAEVQYFICHASEDGGASINEYSEDELKDLLSWDDDSKQIGLMDETGVINSLNLKTWNSLRT
jgi:hypothetical protein